MLVDTGSSIDILFLGAYLKLEMSRAQNRPIDTPLVEFTNDTVSPLGVTNLMVTIGEHLKQAMKMVEFTIVDISKGTYNGIIGWQALSEFEVIVFVIHLKMKFATRYGIWEIQGSQEKGRVLEESPEKGRPHEDVRSVPFDEKDTAKVFKIGSTLGEEHEEMLIRILREYRDIFVWEPKDVPGDPGVAVHRLRSLSHEPVIRASSYLKPSRRENSLNGRRIASSPFKSSKPFSNPSSCWEGRWQGMFYISIWQSRSMP
ncbi:hypothetical protein LIER_35570 [Lithospermum erythrorhizon]|uniref:Uncharacterized protein n=1 Tax=Lithospermum erythrorhizon TaxID=34254 RepID=A0AAV3NSS3_LITER